MESSFLLILRAQLDGGQADEASLRDALGRLERLLSRVAEDLRLVYLGPAVGSGRQQDAHRLCIAEHHWTGASRSWGVAVCSLLPTGQLRADWRLPRVSRERLPRVVAALPELLQGYAELAGERAPARRSSQRLAQIARLLGGQEPLSPLTEC